MPGACGQLSVVHMRHITPMTLIALALALPLAACGSDSDSDTGTAGTAAQTAAAQQPAADSKGGQEAADAFKSCFTLGDYQAIDPDKNAESAFAALARSKGYDNVALNIATEGSELYPAVYVVFFDDAGKASAAIKDLKATTSGGQPPVQKGAAVLAFTDPDTQPQLEPAVTDCL